MILAPLSKRFLDSCRLAANRLLLLFVGPICLACKKYLSRFEPLCRQCRALIAPVVTTTLKITATYQVKVFALSAYQEPIKTLVLAKNAGNVFESRALGAMLWQLTDLKYQPFDLIVAIPLHWSRYASRGFNQAHEMAVAIAAASGRPVVPLLERIKQTQLQSLIGFEQRADNLKEAFQLSEGIKSEYANKHILLIDDVITSGSTAKEAIAVLRTLKPASITLAVACRAV